jgi:hypothetical protein
MSPATVKRRAPVVGDVVRACLERQIEGGQIDFVDDLANVVPAVLTLHAGCSAEQVEDVQRAGACGGIHAQTLS